MTVAPAPAFSVVIPYKQRLENLRLALQSLAEQTLRRDEFEVVIGALEYSDEYLALCRDVSDRLNVVSVLSDRPWQVGLARNLAMRQATGEVLVLLDADMVLPTSALATLRERYFGFGQNVCVAGQMIDYDNNTSDVETVTGQPFEHYRGLLEKLETADEVRSDPRVRTPHVIPWAFAWTAFVAVRRELVERHGLLFDLNFRGYGVEDLEWAYRISRTGTPVVMGTDLFGIHLPHRRNLAQNRRSEVANYRYFLATWPGPDVELACAFGDFDANARYLDLLRQVRGLTGDPGSSLVVVKGSVAGVSTVVIGAVAGPDGRLVDGGLTAGFDPAPQVEVLPLVGLALPWADGSVARCRLLPTVNRLDPPFREAVLTEAARVTGRDAGA